MKTWSRCSQVTQALPAFTSGIDMKIRSTAVHRGRALSRSILALTIAGCLSPAAPLKAPDQAGQSLLVDMSGFWILHVAGSGLDSTIQAVIVDSVKAEGGYWRLRSVPTRRWSGAQAPPLTSGPGLGRASGSQVEWVAATPDGRLVSMRWTVAGDTVTGSFSDEMGSEDAVPLVGIRALSSDSTLLSDSAAPSRSFQAPVILIRLDDAAASDSGIVRRMLDLGLVGELAVPTALVGEPGRTTWDQVNDWAAAGFGVVAHSRHHTVLRSDQAFLMETIGAMGDLAQRGYHLAVFVQPGSWEDSTDFSNPALLQTWRGAFLQSFTRVFEAYARPASITRPVMDSMAMGLGHFTISDGASRETVLEWWRLAQQPNRFTVFLIHSATLPTADALDWFLDSISTAVHTGRVMIARSSMDAFAP